MLRCISFNLDYYWMLRRAVELRRLEDNELDASIFVKKENLDEKNLSLAARTERPLLISEYNFLNYFCYIFYVPLYATGPIIGFNAFVSQINKPQQTYGVGYFVKKTLSIVWISILLEIMLHLIYFHAFFVHEFWKEGLF